MIYETSITIDAQVLNLIAELDEFKGRWEMLSRLAPDKLHLRQLVQQGYLHQHGSGKATWYSSAK